MLRRFFSDVPITGRHAILKGSDAHHLVQVLRARPGMEVILFDGSGAEYHARVESVGQGDVELTVLDRRLVDRELPVPITLIVALPKGERQRWLIEKAVETGVTRLVPLESIRSVVRPTASSLNRLRRVVIEASKQCGRNRLMEIAEPKDFGSCLQLADTSPGGDDRSLRLVGHPGSHSEDQDGLRRLLHPWDLKLRAVPSSLWLIVGPEGGLADEELALTREAGWQLVDLGPRILRVETAAIFMITLAALRISVLAPSPREQPPTLHRPE